ncbi:hypothetical protein TNCV_3692221 [Trichonephila clavipes]|nr:hypothetical protein TNCV_3692221 [Trichonephila clavipes]
MELDKGRIDVEQVLSVGVNHQPMNVLYPCGQFRLNRSRQVGSTASLSEHVQLHSAGKIPNRHQVPCRTKDIRHENTNTNRGLWG